jgi:hypothetical protein
MQSPLGKSQSQLDLLAEQVLQWQAQLSHYSNNDEKLLILQDAEIDSTVETVVQVLNAAAASDSDIVQASLEILAVVALQETAKTLFISSGALKLITELLRKSYLSQKFVVATTSTTTTTTTTTTATSHDEKKDDESSSSSTSNHDTNFQITSTALHCLANLSEQASDAIKHDYLLPVADPLIHNLMDQYLHAPTIQRYACKLIYHLSNPLLQELVAAGSVALLWRAHQAHPNDAPLQHYANASLYNLLPVCPPHILKKTVHPQQLVQGLVPGMTANPTALAVQTYGLLVMTRVATTATTTTTTTSFPSLPTKKSLTARFSQLQSPPQDLQASHALGLDHVIYAILSAMNLHFKDQKVAQVGCNLVKHASKQSIEFCTSMMDHGGLRVLVQIIKTHLDYNSIQDPAMACLRNLLSLRTCSTTSTTTSSSGDPTVAAARAIRNALLVDAPTQEEDDNNNSNNLGTMIRAIGLVMSIHVQDAPIQAYGCDAMGRLAVLDDYQDEESIQFWIRERLYKGNALRLALQSMRTHPQHVGVQDRAIVLLLRLCSYEPAYDFMRRPHEGPVESDDEEVENDGSIDVTTTPPQKKLQQSFLYNLLQDTKVPPKSDSQNRLQQLMSIVDILQDKELLEEAGMEGDGRLFLSKLSVESATERMKSLRDSFSSPNKNPSTWASPLKNKWANRSWQSPSK